MLFYFWQSGDRLTIENKEVNVMNRTVVIPARGVRKEITYVRDAVDFKNLNDLEKAFGGLKGLIEVVQEHLDHIYTVNYLQKLRDEANLIPQFTAAVKAFAAGFTSALGSSEKGINKAIEVALKNGPDSYRTIDVEKVNEIKESLLHPTPGKKRGRKPKSVNSPVTAPSEVVQ